MKASKYFFGLWTVIAVYSLLSFFYGPRGLFAYDQLLEERELQFNNLRELSIINDELERARNSLIYDRDTILAHARQLGFGQENERYIRVVGFRAVNNQHNVAGRVYYAAVPDYLSDRNIKIISLCVGLIVLALLFVSDLTSSKEQQSA